MKKNIRLFIVCTIFVIFGLSGCSDIAFQEEAEALSVNEDTIELETVSEKEQIIKSLFPM